MPNLAQYTLRDPTDITRVYIPDPHQYRFAVSGAKTTFLAGGWGSGKSCALSYWLLVSTFKNPEYTDGAVVLPNMRLCRNFIDNTIKPMWGDLVVGETKSPDSCLHIRGRRKMYYLSGHEAKRIEAYDLCYCGVDEPGLMAADIFPRVAARTRSPKALWLRRGYTGIPAWGWLRDKFDGRQDRKRYIMHCSIFDNSHLDDDARKDIIDSCPAHMISTYIHGQFAPLGTVVYPGFGEKNYIRWRYDPNLETVVVIDPSARTPAVLFAQVLPPGTKVTLDVTGREVVLRKQSVVCYDELIVAGPEESITVIELAMRIKAKRYALSRFICDPAARQIEATSGENTLSQLVETLGIPGQTPPTHLRGVKAGIEHVNLAINPVSGLPTLFVAASMKDERDPRALVPAFRAYGYPKNVDGKPISDEPYKDGFSDHIMDDVRYLVTTTHPTVERLMRPRITNYL